MLSELLPIASGLVAGSLLALIRPSLRMPLGTALAVALGVLATVVSGEFRASWAFLLVDIPLVALASIVGLASVRRARVAWATRD
jgi:hypothetical protein